MATIMDILLNRNYNVCLVNEGGKHRPVVSFNQRPFRDIGEYDMVNVECLDCGITTGAPLPNLETLEWN